MANPTASRPVNLVLVTGATGAIGPSVVETLHQAGCRIRILGLDKPAAGTFPCGIEVVVGNITDAQLVSSAMRGIDTVMHLAALLHRVNPPPGMRQEYERINIGGTRTVVQAAKEAGVIRLLFFSTIGVYGSSADVIFTEEAVPKPETIYADTKLAAERIVLQTRHTDGREFGAVIRLAAVYGARLKGNYERLVQTLARGRFIPIGQGRNRRTLVYVRDVAKAALLVAQHPCAAGKVYNVTDGEYHTMEEIIEVVCDSLGRRPPRLRLPMGPVRCFVSLLEDSSRVIGYRPPINRATLDKYVEDLAVSGARIQSELGFVPEYDLVRGWHETIAEMRERGEL